MGELHTVRSVLRTAGVGGDVSYLVDVLTPAGDKVQFAFRGNLFGGPVLLASRSPGEPASTSTIADPERFGEFATERWVDEYFRAATPAEPVAESA